MPVAFRVKLETITDVDFYSGHLIRMIIQEKDIDTWSVRGIFEAVDNTNFFAKEVFELCVGNAPTTIRLNSEEKELPKTKKTLSRWMTAEFARLNKED